MEYNIDGKGERTMTYSYRFYTIRCLTNMHVGTGDSSFGIVDRHVQKDAITELPTIHASSLKGAIREHCVQKGMEQKEIDSIFGSNDSPGQFRFFDAHLLARPMRSLKKPYYYVLSPQTIDQWNETLGNINRQFGISQVPKTNECWTNEILEDEIEGIPVQQKSESYFKDIKLFLQKDIGINGKYCNVAVMDDTSYKEVGLPVIARNKLENGESKNLWYEEIVPRESIFYTMIGYPQQLKESMEQLSHSLCHQDMVHIGSNATVGIGYTEFKEISVSQAIGEKNQ